jgi:hypothetical protein
MFYAGLDLSSTFICSTLRVRPTPSPDSNRRSLHYESAFQSAAKS